MNKILVAEDNDEVRFLIESILKGQDYSVKTAPNGKIALEYALSEEFDIVVCDIQMPAMNGYDFLKILSKQTSTFKPNFIFLTGKNDRKDMRTGMELGADDFITKPFKHEELINAVKTQLRKRREVKHTLTNGSELLNNIKSMLEGNSSGEKEVHLSSEEKIFVSNDAFSGFVSIKNITAISSVKDYTKILMDDGKVHFIRKPMKTWEEKLPQSDFVRIHRQHIININHIKKIDKWFNYSFKIIMSTTDKIFYSSQRYSVKLRDKLRSI